MEERESGGKSSKWQICWIDEVDGSNWWGIILKK